MNNLKEIWLDLLLNAQNATTEEQKQAAKVAYDDYFNNLSNDDKEIVSQKVSNYLSQKLDKVFDNLKIVETNLQAVL
jgi:hypothetical protein